MINVLRRLWPRRRAADRITMGVHAVGVPKPIALAERSPETVERSSGVWFGFWEDWAGGKWDWEFATYPDAWHTHWLPASAEILPARCCPPEVE